MRAPRLIRCHQRDGGARQYSHTTAPAPPESFLGCFATSITLIGLRPRSALEKTAATAGTRLTGGANEIRTLGLSQVRIRSPPAASLRLTGISSSKVLPCGRGTEKCRLAVPSGDDAIPGPGEGILKPLRPRPPGGKIYRRVFSAHDAPDPQS